MDYRLWGAYSDALSVAAQAVVSALEDMPAPEASFKEFRTWTDLVLATRSRLLSALFALQPFEPFDHACAQRLTGALSDALSDSADALCDGRMVRVPEGLMRADDEWPKGGGIEVDELLKTTFALAEEPVDHYGDFRPTWVFEAYKYDNGRLLQQIAPHLSSLGVPLIPDVLACVAIVGWVSGAPDPVAAAASMSVMLSALIDCDVEVTQQILDHFKGREQTSRQARQRVLAAVTVLDEQKGETQALTVADAYKRLAEGPVRHFGWALRCLRVGSWSSPPTLTPVREALIGLGGFEALIAEQGILVDIRNGEAHENLEWDGHEQVYLVHGRAIEPGSVVSAIRLALGFDRGCEAAMACYRALHVQPTGGLPSVAEGNRMPAWQRAETFFGVNGLRVLTADFNARTASIGLARLHQSDVNPCLQALLCAALLLPKVEVFEVYVGDPASPQIKLPRRALDLTLPVWNLAQATFDMMPFTAFLPANFVARSARETPTAAVRAIAWIAADDALDAYNGAPDLWDETATRTFLDRLGIVELALAQCADLIPDGAGFRHKAVLATVREIKAEVEARAERPLDVRTLETLACLTTVRQYWSAWGPVPRLPNIRDVPVSDRQPDRQPALRGEIGSVHWQTL
ncbi:hypothetical protein ACFQU3_11375 [Terrabacter sp. GCM10028922]|uniref:hypothetical protein n=1 Tax=Terrabacter sp. GCM10028922 TaxID=3273428 RepID=UPI00361923A7